MTRAFHGLVTCPECGCTHTAETQFERWMRAEQRLASRTGIVRFDLDVLIHRYMTVEDGIGVRDIQAMMFLEVKTFGAAMTGCQQDTLSMLSQVLTNRRGNRHHDKRGRHLDDHTPPGRAYSHLLGTKIRLRMFGGHLVQFDAADPVSSTSIRWDGKPISSDQLVQLIRFELDPHTLRLIDWRRRYRPGWNDDMFAEAR